MVCTLIVVWFTAVQFYVEYVLLFEIMGLITMMRFVGIEAITRIPYHIIGPIKT